MRKVFGLLLIALLSLNTQSAHAMPHPEYEFAIELKGSFGIPVNTSNRAWSTELGRTYCSIRELFGEKPTRGQPNESELERLRAASINYLPTNKKLSYHVEGLNISVTCQIAYFVKDGVIEKILPVSTGKASTKSDLGKFKVFYKVKGWQESSLYPGAMMYKPIWYNGNEGVHGMASDGLVHSYPASHGCVRAKKQDMDWLVKNLSIGDTIKVYGKW